MRLFSKILSIILVLFVLSILFVPPVKAGCYFNSYYQCTGTCSCPCGGSCSCVKVWGYCLPSGCNTNCCQYNCRKYSCNSNEDPVSGSCAGIDMVCCKPRPQPTNTPASQNCNWIGYTCVGSCAAGYSCTAVGSYTCACVANTQPTATPVDPGSASPTATPQPTTGGMQCSTTAQCYNAYCAPSLTPIPNCSSVCINGHCYTTNPTSNPTITNVPCQNPNDYGPWSGCLSGQGACGGCASQGYTCQVRYCIHPPNSNQYQISCGCAQPAGGGNSTNIPAPTATPTPNLYWLKLKDTSFRGLSSIPWSSVLSHSLCVFVPSW